MLLLRRLLLEGCFLLLLLVVNSYFHPRKGGMAGAEGPDYVVGVVGALLALGGAAGFARKGSVASLLAGGGSGALFMYWASDLSGSNLFLAKLAAGVLTVAMANRARKSDKLMPTGGIAAVAGALLLYLMTR